MKHSTGTDGAEVSALSSNPSHGDRIWRGTTPVGWTNFNREEARIPDCSHRRGIRHWDTADVYGAGRSRRQIGEIFQTVPADEIVLASKVGWDPGPHRHFYDGVWVRQGPGSLPETPLR